MQSELIEKVKNLPQNPGVYMYKNKYGEIIYVGKAKNLRSRVGSYFFTKLEKNTKTYNLVQNISTIETIIVDNEFDALILEADLIKKYKPKYNIVLKDSKSFLYIVITKDKVPAVVTSRKTNLDDRNKNYGPFTSSGTVRQVVRMLRRVFPYRDCSLSKMQRHRKIKEPCLFGHISVCLSPCVYESKEEIKKCRNNIKKIERILSGKSSLLINELEKNMKTASRNKEYEKAAEYRNILERLNYVRRNYRDPLEYINNPYLMEDKRRKVLEEILKIVPMIKEIPSRIECYDISNISGKEAVGSMVVSTNGALDKDEYRRFKIRYKNTPDDTDMMYEVLLRRFNKDWEHPVLILVDGGKPQVSAAIRALEDANISCSVAGLAKKNEMIVYRDSSGFHEVSIPKTNPGIQHLIQLRDEAHRFAQKYHHLLMSKTIQV